MPTGLFSTTVALPTLPVIGSVVDCALTRANRTVATTAMREEACILKIGVEVFLFVYPEK